MQTVADNHMDFTGKRIATGVVTRSRAEASDRIAALGAFLIQYGFGNRTEGVREIVVAAV